MAALYCGVKYKRVVPSLGAMDLIEELMSADSEHLPTHVCPTVVQVLRDICCLTLLSPNTGIDYSFNLDDNEGVCDLFDVQILNY